MKKVLLYGLSGIGILVLGGYAYISATWKTDYSKEFPVKDLVVEVDEAKLERGRYLVYGPAHCASCHTSLDDLARLEAGEELPLTGGFGLEMPLGTFYAPNITPDKETGIGNHSDGELYRMLRHNIKKDGSPSIDFMPFTDMSEYDILSVIAYIKSQPPVKSDIPKTKHTFMGKVLHKWVIKPGIPKGTPPDVVAKDTTIEYGKYLAESVANCRGCHTDRDLKTGEYIGIEYAGGMAFPPSAETGGWAYITPNLTFDPATGVMNSWSEQDFINRFRLGRTYEATPMPWAPFKSLDDNDLKAIYRFLKSLPPAHTPTAGKHTPPKTS